MQMHAKQRSSYTETFSLLIQAQRPSLASCYNMHLLSSLSPQSKSGFHLSQNYWNSSSCATGIRVSLNISWKSHLHAVGCGHAPNAAAPEAYKCRQRSYKTGLAMLVLERLHIGKRKINVLSPQPFFPYWKCVICPPLAVLATTSQRPLREDSRKRHVGVYEDLRTDLEQLKCQQIKLVRHVFQELHIHISMFTTQLMSSQ